MTICKSVSTLLLGILLAAPAWADERPAAQLRSIRYNGSGCPVGSATAQYADTESKLDLMLPDIVAEWGPGISKVESRKSCILTMDLAVPAGWQYALKSYEFRGYAALDEGMRGDLNLASFFEGEFGHDTLAAMRQTGPKDSDFVIHDFTSIASRQWSPCNAQRAFTVSVSVRVSPLSQATPATARGLMMLDSNWTHELQFDWRRCS